MFADLITIDYFSEYNFARFLAWNRSVGRVLSFITSIRGTDVVAWGVEELTSLFSIEETSKNIMNSNNDNNPGGGSGRTVRSTSLDVVGAVGDPHRALFDACRSGDITSVRQYVTRENINAADVSGRRSTPLHFASGISLGFVYYSFRIILSTTIK